MVHTNEKFCFANFVIHLYSLLFAYFEQLRQQPYLLIIFIKFSSIAAIQKSAAFVKHYTLIWPRKYNRFVVRPFADATNILIYIDTWYEMDCIVRQVRCAATLLSHIPVWCACSKWRGNWRLYFKRNALLSYVEWRGNAYPLSTLNIISSHNNLISIYNNRAVKCDACAFMQMSDFFLVSNLITIIKWAADYCHILLQKLSRNIECSILYWALLLWSLSISVNVAIVVGSTIIILTVNLYNVYTH